MIRSEIPGINPDTYICETNLTFAREFGEKLLNLVNTDTDCLEIRKKYVHPRNELHALRTHPELINDPEKSRRLMARILQIKKHYHGQRPIDFNQYFMSPELTKEFYDLVPNWLKEIVPVVKDDENLYQSYRKVPDWVREIVPGEPLPGIQISQMGDFLAPHKGHPRRSSLFMLLQGNSEETRWYRETEPFEVFDFVRVPDLDKIEHVVTAEIQPFKWYVFNHEEWHSVHRYGSGKRINLGIDFDGISTLDLIELIKKHNG